MIIVLRVCKVKVVLLLARSNGLPVQRYIGNEKHLAPRALSYSFPGASKGPWERV